MIIYDGATSGTTANKECPAFSSSTSAFSLTQGFQFFPPRNTFQLPHHIIALMETFSLTQGFQNTSQHEIDNFNYYKHAK